MRLAEARHAFVSGGASGIGLAIAEALSARGLAVTIADINPGNRAAALAGRGGNWRAAALDVRDRAAWARARGAAEAAFGPVDILVNNAGITPDGLELADMPPDSFERVLAINLGGVFNGVATFAAAMRAAGRGHIVNTASMSGLVMEPGLGSYGPAKAGVIALSEVLRLEMAPHGVGVSVLCPSYVATELMANTLAAGGTLRDPGVSLMAAPMQPVQVAAQVLAAIEADTPYIYTHPERLAAVEQRFVALIGRNAPA